MLSVAAVKPPVEHKIMGFFDLWPKAQFVSEKEADKPVPDNSVHKNADALSVFLCIIPQHKTPQEEVTILSSFKPNWSHRFELSPFTEKFLVPLCNSWSTPEIVSA